MALRRGYRFELVKLLSQWRIRLVFLACLARPGGLHRGGQPAELAAGRRPLRPLDEPVRMGRLAGHPRLHGHAACCRCSPASVAGDVFAVEDRLGTWRHLLVAVRSPRRIFAAKALASAHGHHRAAGRPGRVVASPAGSSRSATTRCPASTGTCIGPGELAPRPSCWPGSASSRPTLAFSAVGLLGSVALGRSPLGLLMPVAARARAEGVQLMPVPVALRVALPMNAFIAYRGLLTDPAQLGAALDRHRRQPGLDGARHAPGLPPLRAPRLHRPGLRRLRPPRASSSAGWPPGRRWSRRRPSSWPSTTGATGSGIERPSSRPRWRRRSPTSTSCRPSELHRPAVTEAQLRRHAPVRQGRRPGRRRGTGQRLALRRHLDPARRHRDRHRRSTSSTWPPDGRTSPTATAPRRSTASSRCAPRRATHRTRCGSSTAVVDLLDTPSRKDSNERHAQPRA